MKKISLILKQMGRTPEIISLKAIFNFRLTEKRLAQIYGFLKKEGFSGLTKKGVMSQTGSNYLLFIAPEKSLLRLRNSLYNNADNLGIVELKRIIMLKNRSKKNAASKRNHRNNRARTKRDN